MNIDTDIRELQAYIWCQGWCSAVLEPPWCTGTGLGAMLIVGSHSGQVDRLRKKCGNLAADGYSFCHVTAAVAIRMMTAFSILAC